jgi:small subunit ribosomal protein S6
MTEGGRLKQYETTIVMDAQLKEEGWEKAIDKYSAIIQRDGSIAQIDRWGVRRLAYEINKQTHGYYVHLIHESKPSVLRELDRQFKLDENCLRYLTVVADNPKYVEEMNKAKARQAAAESESSSEQSSASGDSQTRPGSGDSETRPAPAPTQDSKSSSEKPADQPDAAAGESDATDKPKAEEDQK